MHTMFIEVTIIITPYGTILKNRRVESSNPEIIVLKRKTFDYILLNHIKELKLPVRENMQIKKLWEHNGKINGVISRDDEHIMAKVVVVAAGANSSRFDLKERSCFQAIAYMGSV